MLAPPLTGWLKMVNLSPIARFGPKLSSRNVPPVAVGVPKTEKVLLDGDSDLFRLAEIVPPEMFMLANTNSVTIVPGTAVAPTTKAPP